MLQEIRRICTQRVGLPGNSGISALACAFVLLPETQRQPWPAWLWRLAAYAGRRLGVRQPAGWKQWLLRLIWLPPEAAQPWPQWLRRLAEAGVRRLAAGLGIAADSSWATWTCALCLIPPWPAFDQDHGARAVMGRRLLPGLAWVFEPVLAPVAAGAAALQRRWQSIDFGLQAQRLENTALRTMGPSPWLRGLMFGMALMVLMLTATTPLTQGLQVFFLFVLWGTAMLVRQVPGNLPTLILIGLSVLASARYIWWRLTETLIFEAPLDACLGLGLLLAEIYTWLILFLGFLQTAWPLRRTSAPLPEDRTLWPSVDIYIPTYNEPLKVVKPTVLAALNLEWPADKLKVYLLDDGKRAEFREFADVAGAGYIIRSKNNHAKAGNLNHAMTRTDGELIAIFDCDHVPTRSFLHQAVGWFLRDPKCAMLQTPHHFFSPDPFERNLEVFRQMPNEGNLFYGLVQDGNDLWNATFFCGSCAVIRRKPLQEVGGIAVETVTEDAHTALKLHRRGYSTAYLGITQAGGLATESLSGHVAQRIRWARGMAQIFRIDNPLLGRGLKLMQRLCYANAMLHFFYGLPRIVFLTSPLVYLYFGAHVLTAEASTLVIYLLPHMIVSNLANSRMQGRFRHSFWAEAYETVLAWYIFRPTTVALFAPKVGTFNVTAKGGLIEREYFDWQIAVPFMVLATLNAAGIAIGIFKLLVGGYGESHSLLVNMAWAVYNLILLGTALCVCSESRQIRSAPRSPMRVPGVLELADGRHVDCLTSDYSVQGVGLELTEPLEDCNGQLVRLRLSLDMDCPSFPARVVNGFGKRLALQFEGMSLAQERQWIHSSFGRADAWTDWYGEETKDQPLKSLFSVLGYGLLGYVRLGRGMIEAMRARRQLRSAQQAATA